MKRIMLFISILCFLAVSALAQSNQKKKSATKTQASKTKQSSAEVNTQSTTVLSASNNYSAKTNSPGASVYTISDPTIRTLNARANGSNIRISNSGIVGMPKRAYGFANGRLTFYTTGATSSGTITGTGTVGTGSSLGNIGSFGPAIGLNGKSPYAGSTMWGNATGLQTIRGDSAVRVGKVKE